MRQLFLLTFLFCLNSCKTKSEYLPKVFVQKKTYDLNFIDRIVVSAPNHSAYHCSQIFILPNVALTTAQCVYGPKVKIKQKSSNIEPQRKIIHPLYDPKISTSFVFDYALLIYPLEMQMPTIDIANLALTKDYVHIAKGSEEDGFIVFGFDLETKNHEYPDIKLIKEGEGIIDLDTGDLNKFIENESEFKPVNLAQSNRGAFGGFLLEYSKTDKVFVLRGLASSSLLLESGWLLNKKQIKRSIFLDISSSIAKGFLSEALNSEPNLEGVCCRCQSDFMTKNEVNDKKLESRQKVLEAEFNWKKVKEGLVSAKYHFSNGYKNSCDTFNSVRFYVESTDSNFDAKKPRREQFYSMKKCFEIERNKCD